MLLVFFFHKLEHLFLLFICNYLFFFSNLATAPKKINKNSFSLYYLKKNKLFASKYFLFLFLFILADIILLNKAQKKLKTFIILEGTKSNFS
jgi:hypothetical protein